MVSLVMRHRIVRALGGVFAQLALGCGAASSPPAAPPPSPPRQQTAADFGEYVWAERGHAFARANATCAQSLVFETTLHGYRWGEAVVIGARSDHWIAGQVKISVGGKTSSTFFSNENRPVMQGSDVGDDARCRPRAGTAVAALSAASSSPSSSSPPPALDRPATGEAPRTPSIPITIDDSIAGDARPVTQIFREDVQHAVSDDLSLDQAPASAGTPLRVELWGMSAIDWTGVTFEIRSYEIVPKDPITYRKWMGDRRAAFRHPTDLRPHIEECLAKLGAKECADVHGAACQHDAATLDRPECADIKKLRELPAGESTNTPPPPALAETPPPRPSENAVWVPGHWVYANGSWSFWSPGFFRVSEEDRQQGKTVTAPSAPPPPRPEPKMHEAPPAPRAVWTPGYWHFRVTWIWVEGAWRVPPAAGVAWRPFTWKLDARGSFRLDPGGWLGR